MTSARPLPQVVRQTSERLTALLHRTDPDAAECVEQVRAARPDAPTVVVVGETNRGKSSMVNALLAAPGLSPVDAGAATATYLVLRHGPDWSARACYPGLRDPVPIELSDLAAWTSTAHEPPDGAPPPRHVEVTAPVPLLERLTLVDTPGVGGLDAAHGELAVEAAASATALLFVGDASAPFTAGELEFLRRVSEHVETVVFALTKIDQHRGWRQIINADRELLASHAPRFAGAPIHPVSARLFDSAAAAPTPEVAALLRERSGIAELQTALQRQVSGRAVMLGEANVLRAIATALTGVITRLEADERARAAPGDGAAGRLRRRRDQLAAERRASGRSWQLRLRGEIQRARVESLHEVAAQVRAAQTWFRRAVDDADRADLDRLPYQLDAALHLISVRVMTGLAHRLSRVADGALAELFTAAELDAVRAEFARRGGGRPQVLLRPPEHRTAGAEDRLLIAMGVSGGLGVGRIAALPLAGLPIAGLGVAAGILVLPVTVVLGLGAGWWMSRVRRHAADRAHYKQWLADVLAEARAELDHVVAEQLIDAEQQLALALDDAMGRRVAAIEDELREVDRALLMDAAERNRELAAIRADLAETTAGRDRAEQLLARIRELRDRS